MKCKIDINFTSTRYVSTVMHSFVSNHHLPLEIQLMIVSYLDMKTVFRLRSVCKVWKQEIDRMIKKEQIRLFTHLSKIDCNINEYKPHDVNQIRLYAFLQNKISWRNHVNIHLYNMFINPDTCMTNVSQSILWGHELLIMNINEKYMFDYSTKHRIIIRDLKNNRHIVSTIDDTYTLPDNHDSPDKDYMDDYSKMIIQCSCTEINIIMRCWKITKQCSIKK
jgi:hypothetical protein